jgi:NRPS condensation-like uncharacterized protein/acyl carrier protein
MDERQELVPVGVVGELYIGGDGLARCYYNRRDMTAERFIPHPYGETGGERLYRTGDLVRYLSDGNIEFIGRADEQVKVRGYRVELGEIEAVLSEHPLVKQSMVIASEDGRGGKRLVGYVVCNGEMTGAELRREIRERVPEYMVPEAILVLPELPLTANGKIDRERLPSLKDVGRQIEPEYLDARTPVEEIVAGLFEEVLKQDGVGVRDNFFEIGGHSLLATQVVSRVRSAFGVEIGVRSIFEEPTVEGLARKVEETMKGGERSVAPLLLRASREGRLPLSYAQQRLWFLDQLVPNNQLYNVPRAVRLMGRLDLETLERVINEIVRRHEVLRTRFELEHDQPVQVIDEWEYQKLVVEDLTSLSREAAEEEAKRVAKEEARTGFDLRRGPLLRVRVLKLEEEQHIMLFTMHHIVSDGWSTGILITEVGALYQAYRAGEDSPLAELPIQYADYAVWQRNWLQGEVLEGQLAYWRKQLAELAPLELPADYPRPAVASYRGAELNLVISEKLTEKLQALSRREGVTLFMTLLAAFKTLLSRYSGQEEITVGSPIANRTRAETEGMIGFFVNTLVLRMQVEGNLSFRELLRRVREVCLGAYAHQDVPFERVVEELRPERVIGETPLFQVMFVLQNAPMTSMNLPDITFVPDSINNERAKFDLYMVIAEIDRELRGSFGYNTEIFSGARGTRMLTHFKTLLNSVIENQDLPISQLPIATPEEQLAMVAASRSSRKKRRYHQ